MNNFNKSQTKLSNNLKQVRKLSKIINKLMIIIPKYWNQKPIYKKSIRRRLTCKMRLKIYKKIIKAKKMKSQN